MRLKDAYSLKGKLWPTKTAYFHVLLSDINYISPACKWRRRQWQPTPVFFSGESQGREPGGLPSMRSHRVWHEWSDLAAAAAGALSHQIIYWWFPGLTNVYLQKVLHLQLLQRQPLALMHSIIDNLLSTPKLWLFLQFYLLYLNPQRTIEICLVFTQIQF